MNHIEKLKDVQRNLDSLAGDRNVDVRFLVAIMECGVGQVVHAPRSPRILSA